MSTTGYESALYGSRWEQVHHGYFSDPGIAAPLVGEILKVFSVSRPDVVADLGGGTGFVLEQVTGRCGGDASCFVNVDSSAAQLADTHESKILCLPCQVQDLTRDELMMDEGGRLMFCMRSLLHYFGKNGLRPALRHLRRQMKPGEYFVHQTACFGEARSRDFFNQLYKGLGTGKWYPTVEELKQVLAGEGWRVKAVSPAPSLALTRNELEERYRVDDVEMSALRQQLIAGYGAIPGTFEPEPDASSGDFTAYLHYAILTCQAS